MGYSPIGQVPANRGIGWSIVFSIFTCGIYDLVWDYRMGQEIREHTGRLEINPGLDIFFMIITCNIYYFFWVYKMAGILRWKEADCFPNQPATTVEPWVLLIAAIFGATLVSDAILQHDLNRHWDRHVA